MGDKSKKDKDKHQKQKQIQQQTAAKAALAKQPARSSKPSRGYLSHPRLLQSEIRLLT